MIIQNLAATITVDRAAFGSFDTFKRDNAPFLIDEYFITRTALTEYETRISVLDFDQNPVVSGVVDVYDDIDEGERQLAFVGALVNVLSLDVKDFQLRALLGCYDLFTEQARFPVVRFGDFDDLRLVQRLIAFVQRGGTVEDFFAIPVATRKRQPADYSAHPFRAVAAKIAEAFLLAS